MKKKAQEAATPAMRLRVARERAGFKSAADAVERFGWKQSTYLAHENGQNGIRPDKAAAYADAYRVSVGWLLSGEGDAGHQGTEDKPNTGSIIDVDGTEFARIPVYDVRLSAGHGAVNTTEQAIGFYTISMNMLRDFTSSPIDHLVFVKVKGDSMEPLLATGDWVLVDTMETRLATPAIYAFVNDGEAVIKHASQHLEKGTVTLTSHNPKYEPQTITNTDRLRVIGRIVLSMRKH
jgi:phage repressor protein C with HTH and peptisase S24 domain